MNNDSRALFVQMCVAITQDEIPKIRVVWKNELPPWAKVAQSRSRMGKGRMVLVVVALRAAA
eukprot:3971119-Lingulodinium_polyedra.AAC.1